MTGNSKILPVALVAALLGGSVGAFVMRPSKQQNAAETNATAPATTTRNLTNGNAQQALPANGQNAQTEIAANEQALSDEEMAAYREGFNDGVRNAGPTRTQVVRENRYTPATSRVVYRPATRTRTVSRTSPRRVYYDYSEPRRSRSFWQKHRDKMTVAMGAGGGAIIGGLLGGKKGAAIGALAGGGGSALYTYKLRKRDRRY